jgi:two-component system chemotaxis response regulator CheB
VQVARIRVLAVDDSVVVRRVISEVVGGEPGFEMAGVAANGRIALAMIPQVNPDVIILDVDMPEMDGLDTLVAIRRQDSKTPILMFSALTERGAEATLDALFRGATDYVTKPARMASVRDAAEAVRDQLLPRVRAVCGVLPQAPEHAERVAAEAAATRRRAAEQARIEVLAIGASTGGPNALQTVLQCLPGDLGLPVLVVQHMPPIFTRYLARQLAAKTALTVAEGEADQVVEPGRVYIAPGGSHMLVRRERGAVQLVVNQDPPENSCRPSVDVLFRSVAQVWGAGVLGVVLTGMGRDGLRGSEIVREQGGRILVQDETSSVVWGMPGFVAAAGLAEAVLPLDRVGPEVLRRIQDSGRRRR